jgi:hypothetical protein
MFPTVWAHQAMQQHHLSYLSVFFILFNRELGGFFLAFFQELNIDDILMIFDIFLEFFWC